LGITLIADLIAIRNSCWCIGTTGTVQGPRAQQTRRSMDWPLRHRIGPCKRNTHDSPQCSHCRACQRPTTEAVSFLIPLRLSLLRESVVCQSRPLYIIVTDIRPFGEDLPSASLAWIPSPLSHRVTIIIVSYLSHHYIRARSLTSPQ
jgi:hypothetical protein